MAEVSGPLVVPETLPDDIPDPVAVREHINCDGLRRGSSAIWRFPNGFGASVINGHASFGVELLTIRFLGEGFDDWEPVDWDEIGWLTADRLVEELRQIRDRDRG